MRKLGCNASALLGNSIEENMELIKKAGFDSTFFSWEEEFDLEEVMAKAESLGLEVETLHGPFMDMNSLWEEGTKGDYYTEEIRCCIKAAAKYKIPYVIMHTTVTTVVPKTSHIALMRYGKLVREAEKQGVKLAFENLEYIRHLSLILDTFKSENVGFCYDVGHEVCYTPGIRYLPLFGDRLFCTHIHDNDGFPEDKVVDHKADIHKIPFDGGINFEQVCKELKKCGYNGSLMLEVSSHEPYNFYDNLTPEQFYAKAYAAAVKLRNLIDGE